MTGYYKNRNFKIGNHEIPQLKEVNYDINSDGIPRCPRYLQRKRKNIHGPESSNLYRIYR